VGYSQVRICRINDLRSGNYVPHLDDGAYLPAEFQQDCELIEVNGAPQLSCLIQTTDCPGNTIGPACARVPDIAAGDGVRLQGVNYFRPRPSCGWSTLRPRWPAMCRRTCGEIATPR